MENGIGFLKTNATLKDLDNHQSTSSDIAIFNSSGDFKTSICISYSGIFGGYKTATVDIGKVDYIDATKMRWRFTEIRNCF